MAPVVGLTADDGCCWGGNATSPADDLPQDLVDEDRLCRQLVDRRSNWTNREAKKEKKKKKKKKGVCGGGRGDGKHDAHH